jgi:hypothetical protein
MKSLTLKTIGDEFLQYVYFRQYEKEYFPMLDRHEECDEDGNRFYIYFTSNEW